MTASKFIIKQSAHQMYKKPFDPVLQIIVSQSSFNSYSFFPLIYVLIHSLIRLREAVVVGVLSDWSKYILACCRGLNPHYCCCL